MYPLLDTITDPSKLRLLERKLLPQLADELRQFLVESVAKTGGHLSSNLGTVELTIALHYVFNTPYDRLVWDVGHQTYAHKILTGRREGMSKLRMQGGIAGFPRRDESEYDAFGTAHSSTSISAALGMAVASQREGKRSMRGCGNRRWRHECGYGIRGLEQCWRHEHQFTGDSERQRHVDFASGRRTQQLSRKADVRAVLCNARRAGEKMLGVVPPVLELAKRAEEHVKGMVTPSTLFEEFGFNYIGPIDGHDLDVLVSTLNNIKHLDGPQFLHIVTRKGAGYKAAEEDPDSLSRRNQI